jgi:outer membrane protein OmpA-like peptidoglycan-associated protein
MRIVSLFIVLLLAGCASHNEPAQPAVQPGFYLPHNCGSTKEGLHFCAPTKAESKPAVEERPVAVLDSEAEHLDGVLPFEEKITFAKNSAAVSKSMMKKLKGLAGMMLVEPKYNINVIGVSSTAEQPGVAKRRADVAVSVLLDSGIDKSRIRSTYFRVKPDSLNSSTSLRKVIFTNA